MPALIAASTRRFGSWFSALIAILYACVRVCSAADVGGHEDVVSGVPAWLGVGVLGAQLVAGYFFYLYACTMQTSPSKSFVQYTILGASYLHAFAQFLPYIALALGWVGCDSGVFWVIHWAYMFVLMLALPMLGGADHKTAPLMELPFGLGMKGSMLARSSCFGKHFMGASDLYTDNMAIAIAFACDWHLARVMLIIMIVGLLLQAVCAYYATGHPAFALYVLMGFSPEAAELQETAAELHYSASQGISKFFTENCPQAYLAIRFALEMKPSLTVWVSVAFSLALGAQSCQKGCKHYQDRRIRDPPKYEVPGYSKIVSLSGNI